MLKNLTYLLLVIVLAFSSCKKEDNLPGNETKSYSISGSVQKGPFVNGTDLTFYELDHQFKQTGRSFHTTIGSLGQFELTDVALVSPYLELVADGFYYNEIAGTLSNERISLKAIVDLSNLEVININILTNLEYDRVKHLISKAGYTIQDAKTQAQHELLVVFSLDSINIDNAETLDIIHTGEGDALLLAVSAIMQGNHTTAELSNLIADLVSDMKEDGVLDDTLIQNDILGQAFALNCPQIKQNLMDRYNELGVVLDEINNFEEYVAYFLAHSTFHYSPPFTFPGSTSNGLNVLDPNRTELQINTDYSFAIEMPGAGNIVIKMHKTAGRGSWYYSPSQTYGWQVSQYDFGKHEQVFTSTLNGVTIDLPIQFTQSGTALIEYFYNGSETPNHTKNIAWGGDIDTNFIFPDDSYLGINLLNLPDSAELGADTSCMVGLSKPGTWDINFVLSYTSGVSITVSSGRGVYTYEETEGQVNFKLSGTDQGDYISEIGFHLVGEGEIMLVSDDLKLEEESGFARSYFVNAHTFY